MKEETKLEVIKALSYGENIEDIANMAEIETNEVEQISKECAGEIKRRREEIAGGYNDGN